MEIIEQLLNLSRLTDSAAERQSFLSTVLVRLDRDAADLPAGWASATAAKTRETIDADLRVERSYQTMIGRLIEQAEQRARLADVRGVGRVLAEPPHQRPGAGRHAARRHRGGVCRD